MASRALIHHKTSRLKSLGPFYSLLPEFSEVPRKLDSVVDKAFFKALVDAKTDVREWKGIREEALSKKPDLTPREIARFKFALCNRGEFLVESYLGRPALHQWLDEKAIKMIPHMNAVELVSLLTAYGNSHTKEFYAALISQLLSEIKAEENLDVLSVGLYAINSHFNTDRKFIPLLKDPTHSKAVKDFTDIVSPKIIEKVTEFTDDQFATICAGIGKVGIGFPNIERLYNLTDNLKEDFLRRRIQRMSLENLIDVAAGFFYTNLAPDDLARAITEKITEKKSQLNYFTAVDCALALSARQPCSEELLKHINTLVKSEMAKEDYLKISTYIFNTQCKDEEILSKHMKHVIASRPIPSHNYEVLKKHKFYLERYSKHLVTDEFIQILENSGYLYNANRLLNDQEEFNNEHFENAENWFRCLRINHKSRHLHNNHEVLHFAIKPQNVAIQIALPKFHLIGKWEEDMRILKEPKRKFKISNQFENKCRWLELLGFKVIRINYQEIAENCESKEMRDKNFLDLLRPLGIEATEEKRRLK